MPRNMSFSLTTDQFIEETKNVTRRLGWGNLLPGELFNGVRKGMGLRKGEKVEKLHLCRCVSNTPERVDFISQADVAREGFPNMSRQGFVEMFCRHNKCQPAKIINRIEYAFLREPLQFGGVMDVPKQVATCPECGSKLAVRSTSWLSDTGVPHLVDLEPICLEFERLLETYVPEKKGFSEEFFGHGFKQSDWQPFRDRIELWTGGV